MTNLRISGYNTNSNLYFKGNTQKKDTGINKPLAGKITMPTPGKKPQTKFPQPLAGLIEPPTIPQKNPLPTIMPPLAGLVTPPNNRPSSPLPTVLPPLAGLVSPKINPRPGKVEINPIKENITKNQVA